MNNVELLSFVVATALVKSTGVGAGLKISSGRNIVTICVTPPDVAAAPPDVAAAPPEVAAAPPDVAAASPDD